jgi:hypothetical protein
MRYDKRTERERIYFEILKKRGASTNTELRKAALEYQAFRGMSDGARDKDVDRFVARGLYSGILTRQGARVQLFQPLKGDEPPRPRRDQLLLSSDGFLTSRAGVKCEHCGHIIDLATVEKRWRPKSATLARMLHVHHFFRTTCPKCGWVGRYDTGREVKPILPQDETDSRT